MFRSRLHFPCLRPRIVLLDALLGALGIVLRIALRIVLV